MKQVADGAISGRTARLSQPYVGHPNDYGTFSATEEELYENGHNAPAAGWQLGTHANGDVAIERVLSVYERINRERHRRDPPFRIEHCTLINDSIIQRMQALHAIPASFSRKCSTIENSASNTCLRCELFLAGLHPTQASDYPPGEFPAMMALQSEVTRTDMKGNVWARTNASRSRRRYELAPSTELHASCEENLRGSIEPGKLRAQSLQGKSSCASHHPRRAHHGRRQIGVRILK